jgi:hypothetical protein
LRRQCQEDLDHLRNTPEVSERLFRLLERLAHRLTRIETGDYGPDETPTRPERRPTPPPFIAANVTDILEGKK